MLYPLFGVRRLARLGWDFAGSQSSMHGRFHVVPFQENIRGAVNENT